METSNSKPSCLKSLTDVSVFSSIAVVHLVWVGSGFEQFQTFIKSYKKFHPGIKHQLIIAFKGFENNDEVLSKYISILENIKCEKVYIPNKGKDIFSYKNITFNLPSAFENILFLNSSSEVLCNEWLKKFDASLKCKTTGIVGATGSWERRDKTEQWPNSHLRTNAFYGQLSFLKSLNWGGPEDGLTFEAGPTSLYSQVKANNLNIKVVGKNGLSYLEDDWKESATFRSFGQQNLIIADNRTRDYSNADKIKKMWLHIMAWHLLDPGPNPDKRGRASYTIKRFIYNLKKSRKTFHAIEKAL